jgi:tRNA threonylcarbamoyl adenosine modification protein YeaZ
MTLSFKDALILETSTERGLVAVGGRVQELPYGLLNSQNLLPELQSLLHKSALPLEQIKLIVVGAGPGSYTGIRVAATVAKTLSFAKRIPLVAVNTLKAFIPDFDTEFATIIDAKIAGVYLIKGKRHKEVITYSEARVLPLQEAAPLIAEVPVLVTPNKNQLEQKFENVKGKWIESAPSAEQLFNLGLADYHLGLFSLDGSCQLNYMRKTQAEIERDEILKNGA